MTGDRPRGSVVTLDDLARISAACRLEEHSVVLCHGCFDILHVGHVRHLRAAADEGNLLFVTVTTDEYVGKGPGRPVFPAQVRAEVLASLRVVDYVALNPAPTALEVLSSVRPAVFAKGDEYAADTAQKARFDAERRRAEELGIRVVFTREAADSSSRLVPFVRPDARTLRTADG
jgi:rfaE bifunctional protein nucleotidyltransferase chain/domain